MPGKYFKKIKQSIAKKVLSIGIAEVIEQVLYITSLITIIERHQIYKKM